MLYFIAKSTRVVCSLAICVFIFWTQHGCGAKDSSAKTSDVRVTDGDQSSKQVDEKSKVEKNSAPQVIRYSFRAEHDPNGIGKFYMGREIAHVMGYPAAVWLERPEREEEEKLSKLVEALKLKPGMTVADIGAGSGRISMMMAEKVGAEGKIYAVDIQDEMLALLEKKAKQLGIKNVVPVLGTRKSPELKADSIDLALMVDVYHEFDLPYEMLGEIAKSLKPGGRIAFVEYRREDPKVRRMIKLVHTMTEAQVKKEASQSEFGLKWKETIGVLPVQHIIIFERLVEEGGPRGGSQK